MKPKAKPKAKKVKKSMKEIKQFWIDRKNKKKE
jgi:hypothetical protein